MLVPALIPYDGQMRVAFIQHRRRDQAGTKSPPSWTRSTVAHRWVPSTKAFQEPSAGTEGSCL